MRKIIIILLTIVNIVSCATAQDKERQANINSIFDKIELQGVDISKPLLYGYFFYDKDKSKLEKLKNELLKDNYKLVRLEKTEKQEFILHVEKVEIHTRASLLEREKWLEQIAEKFQVQTYDGWDVGNADPTQPLVAEENIYKSLQSKTDEELYKLANDFYDSEIYDKAVAIFQKCIDHNYKPDTCYYKQGVCYVSTGQAKTGIEKLEQAIKINSKYFNACFNIGAACYDNHEYQKSVEYYQKAAKLDSKNDDVYYGIAAAQFVLGQLNNAEMNCKTALNLNPNNYNAKTLLQSIQLKK